MEPLDPCIQAMLETNIKQQPLQTGAPTLLGTSEAGITLLTVLNAVDLINESFVRELGGERR